MNYSEYVLKDIDEAPFTESMQKDFESAHGISMPLEYKSFLYQMNGGEPKKKIYTLPDYIPQIGYGYLTINRFSSVSDLAEHISFINERGDLYGLKQEMGDNFFTNEILPIADGNLVDTFIGLGIKTHNLGVVFWLILDWDKEGKPYKPVRLESNFQVFIARMTN